MEAVEKERAPASGRWRLCQRGQHVDACAGVQVEEWRSFLRYLLSKAVSNKLDGIDGAKWDLFNEYLDVDDDANSLNNRHNLSTVLLR